jgi:hypothetical protein
MQATADGARLVLTASVGVTGKPQFVFKNNFTSTTDTRDTISRTAGSWLDDGFRPGFKFSVTGTKRFFGLGENNDGVYTVAEISADGLVLTLDTLDRWVRRARSSARSTTSRSRRRSLSA